MPERPILKLKLPKSKTIDTNGVASEQPASATTGKKIKLKFGGAKTATAPAEPASTPKTPKIVLKTNKKEKEKEKDKKKKKGKKRGREDDGGTNGIPQSANTVKRIKFTAKNVPKTPTTPFIKLKTKGKPPVKPMGIGYDSEASDAEEDPHIEEEFVLRMQPGDDCEYVRNAIANRNWGPVRQGGADIKLKFLRADGRRALLVVRGKMYAASMVDLPCILEGMKSWDKKGWWKTADICQMLLVLGTVATEEDALTYPLPDGDVKKGTFMYEHGLTPPMRWVRKRRFRKRVNADTVRQVEEEVDDLFARDAEAASSDYKLMTWDEIEDEQRQQEEENAAQEAEDYFEDADGEVDEDLEFEGAAEVQDDEDEEDGEDWEKLMDEAEEEAESQAATPAAATTPAGTSVSQAQADTHPSAAVTDPATLARTDSDTVVPGTGVGGTTIVDGTDEAETPGGQADEDDEEEEEEDESGSDADADDVDEEADDEELEIQRKRDEIADIERAIEKKITDMQKITSAILQERQKNSIRSLQEDLRRQKAAIGEADDDD